MNKHSKSKILHPKFNYTEGVIKMNDIITTIVGNAVSEVVLRSSSSGKSMATFRIANNPRRFEKTSNSWIELDPNFVSINCWSFLAENVATSVRKGQPLVVTGKLKIRQWQDGEKSGTAVELDAISVGHDLNWGKSEFTKVKKTSSNTANDAWFPEGLDAEVNVA